MKKTILTMALILSASPLMAAQQTILGGTGHLWGDEKVKINSNFSELYGKLAQALLTTSSPTFVDLTLTSDLNLKDWIYFTSDDDTHYVAVAAGNNTANFVLRWPTAAPGGTDYILTFDSDGAGGWTDPSTFLTPTGAGGSLTVVSTGFDGNLSVADNTVQEVAQKLDDLVAGGAAAEDTAYSVSTWNGDTDAPSKNAIRDYMYNFDADGDGSFSDEAWFPSTSGAPTSATYLTTTSEAGLSAEANLGALTTGLVKITVAAGTATPSTAVAGTDYQAPLVAGTNYLRPTTDVDDSPVNSETAQPISSNWAWDHVAGTDPHTGYMLESNIGTGSGNYVQLNASSQLPAVSGALLTNLPAATALSAQYIDWNASSGGNSIANKPTIPTISDAVYGAGWNGDTGAASKNAIYDKIETIAIPGAGIPNSTGSAWGTSYTLDTNIITGVSSSDDTIPSAKAVDAALDAKADVHNTNLTGTTTINEIATSAADGSRRSKIPNNTSIAPFGSGEEEIYNEAGQLKVVESATEYDLLNSGDIDSAITNGNTTKLVSSDQAYDALAGKQAYDAQLDTWSGVSPGTGVATWIGTPSMANFFTALTGDGAFADDLLGYADAAAVRAGLDLEAGTDFNAYDTDIADLADGSLTASKVAGAAVTTASKSSTYTIGTDSANESYGGTIYVTSATTITAPAVAAGMNFSVVTIGDIAVSLDVNSSDKMILDGVTLADGDKATNSSKAGDTITCQYYSADGWYCWSGTVLGGHWTDGN